MLYVWCCMSHKDGDRDVCEVRWGMRGVMGSDGSAVQRERGVRGGGGGALGKEASFLGWADKLGYIFETEPVESKPAGEVAEGSQRALCLALGR